MRKSDLFELVREIKRLAPGEMPIIVGSQAVHAVASFLPEIVRQSIECDFLFAGGKTETRTEVNKKLGVFSLYQLEHGFYADALGLATVVLPTGWRERLQPLEDENGNVVAFCAEIHDVAVSKLIAGREKDFLFLNEAFLREYISIDEFLERVKLVRTMPQSEVLVSRLENLVDFIPNNYLSAVKKILAELKSSS